MKLHLKKANTSKDQLLDSVLRLADALSSVDKLGEYFGVPTDDAINTLIEDMLDTDYIYNSRGELLGAEIMKTVGGPNIWIETRYKKVVGVWGSDRFERSYTDGIGLDELIEDMAPSR